jgi:hypothetical protein
MLEPRTHRRDRALYWGTSSIRETVILSEGRRCDRSRQIYSCSCFASGHGFTLANISTGKHEVSGHDFSRAEQMP